MTDSRKPLRADEALAPCPFCDGADIRIDRHTDMRSPTGAIFSMCCYNCGATFPNRYKRELLVEAWNRREGRALPHTNPDGEVAVLREAREIVAKQAMDEGLWHIPWSAPEAHMQKALRDLHVAIEGKTPAQCAEGTLADLIGEAVTIVEASQ